MIAVNVVVSLAYREQAQSVPTGLPVSHHKSILNQLQQHEPRTLYSCLAPFSSDSVAGLRVTSPMSESHYVRILCMCPVQWWNNNIS